MRIDLYLKRTLIFKKRSEAKVICGKALIRVNGKHAKPSRKLNIGDLLEIETVKGIRKIKVLQMPAGNIRKDEISSYYEEL